MIRALSLADSQRSSTLALLESQSPPRAIENMKTVTTNLLGVYRGEYQSSGNKTLFAENGQLSQYDEEDSTNDTWPTGEREEKGIPETNQGMKLVRFVRRIALRTCPTRTPEIQIFPL